MMRGVMASEWLKIRRKGIWLLIALGPLGVVGLQALNFFLRYDYLTKRYADDLWGAVIGNVHQLSVPTLLMGIAIVASMIAGIEHQTNAWKQTLALPVSKWCVFACKFTLLCTLLVCACTLLAAGDSGSRHRPRIRHRYSACHAAGQVVFAIPCGDALCRTANLAFDHDQKSGDSVDDRRSFLCPLPVRDSGG